MENLNIIAMVYFNVIILWVVLPPLVSIGACLLNHWTRGRADYTPMEYLAEKIGLSYDPEGESAIYYGVYHLAFPFVILACTSWLMIHHPITTILSVVGFLSFIFLPRYLCDIINSLKFNFKKADSERLLELEQEIQKIKSNTRHV